MRNCGTKTRKTPAPHFQSITHEWTKKRGFYRFFVVAHQVSQFSMALKRQKVLVQLYLTVEREEDKYTRST
jgi:fumarate reductase subunit C